MGFAVMAFLARIFDIRNANLLDPVVDLFKIKRKNYELVWLNEKLSTFDEQTPDGSQNFIITEPDEMPALFEKLSIDEKISQIIDDIIRVLEEKVVSSDAAMMAQTLSSKHRDHSMLTREEMIHLRDAYAARATEIYRKHDRALVDVLKVDQYSFIDIAAHLLFNDSLEATDLKTSERWWESKILEFSHSPAGQEFTEMVARFTALSEILGKRLNENSRHTIPTHTVSDPSRTRKPYLDLASGVNILFFFPNLDRSHHYIFVDTSNFVIAYLDEARKVLSLQDQAELKQQDVFDLEFTSEYFETIRLENVVPYLSQTHDLPAKFISKIIKAITPGGELIIETLDPAPNKLVLTLMRVLHGWGYEVTMSTWGNTIYTFTKPNQDDTGNVERILIPLSRDNFHEIIMDYRKKIRLMAHRQGMSLKDYDRFVKALPRDIQNTERRDILSIWQETTKQVTKPNPDAAMVVNDPETWPTIKNIEELKYNDYVYDLETARMAQVEDVTDSEIKIWFLTSGGGYAAIPLKNLQRLRRKPSGILILAEINDTPELSTALFALWGEDVNLDTINHGVRDDLQITKEDIARTKAGYFIDTPQNRQRFIEAYARHEQHKESERIKDREAKKQAGLIREYGDGYIIHSNGLLEGSIYNPAFMAGERKRALDHPTIVFDKDGTILEIGTGALREGILEQLKKLRQLGYRLVLWTDASQENIKNSLGKFPEVTEQFDLMISGRNNNLPFGIDNNLTKVCLDLGLTHEDIDRLSYTKPFYIFGYKAIVEDRVFNNDIQNLEKKLKIKFYSVKSFRDDEPDTEPIDQLADRVHQLIQSDKAMLSDKPLTKGGIDFNPQNINLETQGEGANFNIPGFANFSQLQNIQIDGFAPVIFTITALDSLRLFLGIATKSLAPQ